VYLDLGVCPKTLGARGEMKGGKVEKEMRARRQQDTYHFHTTTIRIELCDRAQDRSERMDDRRTYRPYLKSDK